MRARNIKPSFFKNEEIAECSPFARLLFTGLWCMADLNGNLENRPKLIKAEVFPHDNLDVTTLINELASHQLVKHYTVDGKNYLWIPSWEKHGRPHPKEPSLYPVMTLSQQNVTKNCETGPVALLLTPTLSLTPTLDGANNSKAPPKPNPTPRFESTPAGIAMAWTFYLRGRSPRIDDQPPKSTEFFEEMIGQGIPGEKILAAVNAKRDRSEQLFHLKDRLLPRWRNGPAPPLAKENYVTHGTTLAELNELKNKIGK